MCCWGGYGGVDGGMWGKADEVEGDLLLLYNVIIIHRQDHWTQWWEPREKLLSSKAKTKRRPTWTSWGLRQLKTDEMWKENQGDEEDWRLEVEGEAEVSVVEFGKKNEKKRTGLAQKEEIQKNEKSKDKKVLKKGGWEEKRINTAAYSQLQSIPSMDF